MFFVWRIMKKAFSSLGRTDYIVWAVSVALVILSYFLSASPSVLNTLTSVIGVSALIFVARGQVLGQLLLAAFALLYGTVSVFHSYFGETAICFLLSLPLAAFAIVTWYKNPYDDSGEVKVSRISARQLTLLILLTAGVTVAFYFILSLLGTASVIWSTVSVTTSFFAAGLTVLRSPYFALGYVANDIILIVLWTIAAIGDPSCVSMVVCFAAFLLNDSYSFICWYRRKYLQAK